MNKEQRYGWDDDIGRKGEFLWLNPDEIDVDEKYQRGTSLAKARKIASRFKWERFVVVVIFKRGQRYYTPDGGHRVLAAKLRGLDSIPCLLFTGGTLAREADAFVEINTGRGPVHGIDKWKAELVRGNPECREILDLLASCGLAVGRGPGEVRAAQTLLRLHKRGGLGEVLSIVSRWPGETPQGPLLDGLDRFLATAKMRFPEVDMDKVAQRLSKKPMAFYTEKARRIVQIEGGSYAVAYSKALAAGYDKGLPADKKVRP